MSSTRPCSRLSWIQEQKLKGRRNRKREASEGWEFLVPVWVKSSKTLSNRRSRRNWLCKQRRKMKDLWVKCSKGRALRPKITRMCKLWPQAVTILTNKADFRMNRSGKTFQALLEFSTMAQRRRNNTRLNHRRSNQNLGTRKKLSRLIMWKIT